MRLSDESLRGRTVVASDGVAVGTVTMLFIDVDGWRVESLQTKLHRNIADRIGADRSWLHAGVVEIPIRMVQSVGDAVVLLVGVDGLRQVLPRTSESAAPSP